MEAAGQHRIVRAEDVAHMGITEVIRHLLLVYGEYRRLLASVKKEKPAVAVLIDFPDVNLRLARELKLLNIPVIYFVSPQLWAWKKWRIRQVRERVARMLTIFPFEVPFYRARGVDAAFVGHPLADLPLPDIKRGEYGGLHGLDPARQWIALLPGSRMNELKLNLPAMLEAAGRLGNGYEFLLPLASTLQRQDIEALIVQSQPTGHRKPLLPPTPPTPPTPSDPPTPGVHRAAISLHVVNDARDALFHARASVVASGTATVQAALIGNPFLVVYRVSNMTFALARHLVSYPPEILATRDEHGNLPVAMVNLIAGKRAVPELLQGQFTGANVVAHLKPLLDDQAARDTMKADLAAVRKALLADPGLSPADAPRLEQTGHRFHAIERVCDAVLEQLAISDTADMPDASK